MLETCWFGEWELIERQGRRYMVRRGRDGRFSAVVPWGQYLIAKRREREIRQFARWALRSGLKFGLAAAAQFALFNVGIPVPAQDLVSAVASALTS